MTRPLSLAPLILALSFTLTLPASAASPIAGGLSEDQISLRPDFTGASILVFGALDDDSSFSNDSSIIITLTGPRRDVGIWQKARIVGIWTNYVWRRFSGIPAFYAIAATRSPREILTPASRRAHHIGAETFLPLEAGAFGEALLRIKKERGVFPRREEQVVFLGQRLFRAAFTLPASVPVGIYRARIYFFEGGRLRDMRLLSLQLDKRGLAEEASRLAWESPFLYGLVAVLMGLVIGWTASALMRRR